VVVQDLLIEILLFREPDTLSAENDSGQPKASEDGLLTANERGSRCMSSHDRIWVLHARDT